ncbi:terminase small subunit [Rathayibacter phage NCPPB3778]|nr:terminase small subunit [Rathayibacter phage NCPPB3778]
MPIAESPCGTYTAFQRHRRRHEPIDDKCMEARDAHNAARRKPRPEPLSSEAEVELKKVGLKKRGRSFYKAVVQKVDLPLERLALVLEAARMLDRLEALHRAIGGEGIVKHLTYKVPQIFDQNTDVVAIELKIDNLVSETRQAQLAFDRLARNIFSDMAEFSKEKGEEVDRFAEFFNESNVTRISKAAN